MAVAVEAETVRALMSARGLDVTALAKRAGLSRQAVHRLLQPGHCPVSRGFVAVAEALGVSTVAILGDAAAPRGPWQEATATARSAATGDARSFEMLPASVRSASASGAGRVDSLEPVLCQLIAAAAQVADALKPSKRMRRVAAEHAASAEPGRAFFFAADLMSPERIVVSTPPAMARHLVFGAFSMDAFARHLR